MKSLSRNAGVTLLEIMLVLAIAAMVIVMSIRYYQQATQSQQSNSVLQQILSMSAAADNLAQGTGSYSGVTSANVKAIVGDANLKTPWGSSFTFASTATTYTVTVDKLPGGVCAAVSAKVKANSKYTGTCDTTATPAKITVVYTTTSA
jgi:type II secretory pathway pseudopilin PulG